MEKEESLVENEKLSRIIQRYADIWADVKLDKNLMIHLKRIEDDLGHLNKLIDLKEARKLNTLPYYRIANQCFRLLEIIRDKLSRLNH